MIPGIKWAAHAHIRQCRHSLTPPVNTPPSCHSALPYSSIVDLCAKFKLQGSPHIVINGGYYRGMQGHKTPIHLYYEEMSPKEPQLFIVVQRHPPVS